jgi:hypothetical protein
MTNRNSGGNLSFGSNQSDINIRAKVRLVLPKMEFGIEYSQTHAHLRPLCILDGFMDAEGYSRWKVEVWCDLDHCALILEVLINLGKECSLLLNTVTQAYVSGDDSQSIGRIDMRQRDYSAFDLIETAIESSQIMIHLAPFTSDLRASIDTRCL